MFAFAKGVITILITVVEDIGTLYMVLVGAVSRVVTGLGSSDDLPSGYGDDNERRDIWFD